MDKKKTVVLGVSGGIAAYKALDIVSRLKKKEIDVHVIMTDSAIKFVTPLSFQSLSQNQVVVNMFQEPKSWEIQHISLAEKADLFVIAPATANVIGKIANGIADDMLTTTVMATKAPVLIAPAMNTNMFENPVVQRNISTLRELNYYFVEPTEGRLACGVVGKGKLADTEIIADKIEMLLHGTKDLKGKKVLVTAGPTREDIDPVRFITNRSTGKMGYAIAKAARDRGAEVTLVSGPTSLMRIPEIKHIDVYSAQDMFEAVMERAEDSDIIIKSAAVGDYRPAHKSDIKIKKSEDDLSISLCRNRDILSNLGNHKSHQILVGFAAESNDLIENAISKIQRKNLDMIIANDITMRDAGFGVDTNIVKIISRDGNIKELPSMSKEKLAHEILDEILKIER